MLNTNNMNSIFPQTLKELFYNFEEIAEKKGLKMPL